MLSLFSNLTLKGIRMAVLISEKLIRLVWFVVMFVHEGSGMPFWIVVPGVEGCLCRKQSDYPPYSNGPSVCDLGICFCFKGGLAPPVSSTLPKLFSEISVPNFLFVRLGG
ncbi:hypothetical protein COLO4_30931 [Corchorus olitorius]|uniref:Uncharacterized protein n=1 Tax=Corchorus olitorius TaxID=93759 RepID=A0A1R3H6B4_9ROSI|nr:hypothetical protein COLO4_30931 [Corchorus olitorius]